jgi:hypothetical protein
MNPTKEQWNSGAPVYNINKSSTFLLWLGWPLWNICVPYDHGYVLLVVSTSRFFPHSRLIIGFVTRLTRRMSLLEQELPTLPEHLNRQHNGRKKKYKTRSIKHTYKTEDRVTRTPLKIGGELRCSGRVGSSCSSDIRILIVPLVFSNSS